MRLVDALKLATWGEVEACLRCHYCKDEEEADGCDRFVSDHALVYAALLELHPEAGDTVVHIDLEEEDGVEAFDVYGIKPSANDAWALELTRWELWLGMEVAPSTLQRFSPSEIVAHCINEMSFVGYDPEQVAEFATVVEHRREEAIHNGNEYEPIDAEDVFREEHGNDPIRLEAFYRELNDKLRRSKSDHAARRILDSSDDHG